MPMLIVQSVVQWVWRLPFLLLANKDKLARIFYPNQIIRTSNNEAGRIDVVDKIIGGRKVVGCMMCAMLRNEAGEVLYSNNYTKKKGWQPSSRHQPTRLKL